MKWNWGTKILIAIILFMTFIFVLVYMTTQNNIYLVEKDYYPKGLKYQDRLNEINNAKALSTQFNVVQNEKEIVVNLPKMQPDSGTILFFRPSNTSMDRSYLLTPDSAMKMKFPSSDFVRGKYLIKVSWHEKKKGYYFEKPFYCN